MVAQHEHADDQARLTLSENDVDPDPVRQFLRWFNEATLSEMSEPNAMTLATATTDGRPSARTVLLRGVDERGFAFFTNYESRKGRELEANPRAALVFFWDDLERQVRVEGRVERVSVEESDQYFHGRPINSRIGAWASPQSEVIASREELEKRCRDFENEFADGTIPRPPHWGGYRVVPETIEFWLGRSGRLHDRLRYKRDAQGRWVVERLAP